MNLHLFRTTHRVMEYEKWNMYTYYMQKYYWFHPKQMTEVIKKLSMYSHSFLEDSKQKIKWEYSSCTEHKPCSCSHFVPLLSVVNTIKIIKIFEGSSSTKTGGCFLNPYSLIFFFFGNFKDNSPSSVTRLNLIGLELFISLFKKRMRMIVFSVLSYCVSMVKTSCMHRASKNV